MDPPDRFSIISSMTSPPPSYDSVSTFEPDDYYGDVTSVISSPSSPASPGSSHQRQRRFSDASEVLPPTERRSHNSSGSSQRSDYAPYLNAAGLPTPPLAPRQPAVSIMESLRLDVPSRMNNPAANSFFSVSETDDPAVIRNFPEPPRGYYPSPSPTASNASLRPPVRTTSQSTYAASLPTQMPQAQPPRPELPPLPYICTFQEKQYGQMILAPPENWTDQTPMYHIEVYPNCFMPSSYITSISRGNGQRELVARFEMGISRGQPTVFIGQHLHPMSDVFFKFRKVNSRLGSRWIWQHGGFKLHWDCRSETESVCSHESDPEHTPIARIKPASSQPPGNMSTRPPATRLEIYVQTAPLIDEIVVSALIVERKRLSPMDGNKNEELFN
ncbi:hypothetical protein EIP86_010519 [Pleurotus ostreatoroseus]|nr:hypothetical protein EIP86_010519 [Pleurotus ostreatoroseus]